MGLAIAQGITSADAAGAALAERWAAMEGHTQYQRLPLDFCRTDPFDGEPRERLCCSVSSVCRTALLLLKKVGSGPGPAGGVWRRPCGGPGCSLLHLLDGQDCCWGIGGLAVPSQGRPGQHSAFATCGARPPHLAPPPDLRPRPRPQLSSHPPHLTPAPFSGLYVGTFGPHGPELLRVSRQVEGGQEWAVATKLTGDPNVPAGAVSWKALIGRANRLPGARGEEACGGGAGAVACCPGRAAT